MSSLKVTFLAHSGFVVETATKVLVFDYYEDDQHIVDAYRMQCKPLWFFVSHWHGDHFNRRIADFSEQTAHYVVNKDVPLNQVPKGKLQVMKLYEKIMIEDTQISHYGSTDEGGSFLVQTDGCRIFHAGDLNWWHWIGDTDANNAEAKQMYDREIKKLSGQTIDVVFFPVDARLETAREWGVNGFLDCVTVRKCLIPMHYFGAPWQPSEAFQQRHGEVPLWIPKQNGETTEISYIPEEEI